MDGSRPLSTLVRSFLGSPFYFPHQQAHSCCGWLGYLNPGPLARHSEAQSSHGPVSLLLTSVGTGSSFSSVRGACSLTFFLALYIRLYIHRFSVCLSRALWPLFASCSRDRHRYHAQWFLGPITVYIAWTKPTGCYTRRVTTNQEKLVVSCRRQRNFVATRRFQEQRAPCRSVEIYRVSWMVFRGGWCKVVQTRCIPNRIYFRVVNDSNENELYQCPREYVRSVWGRSFSGTVSREPVGDHGGARASLQRHRVTDEPNEMFHRR